MPFSVIKEYRFEAAHRIADHPGKCRRMHGHNYRVRVKLDADRLDELGMVADFSLIKSALQEVAGRFDHRVINDVAPFDELPSTAENLAVFCSEELAKRLDDSRVKVARVEIWENDSSAAIFEPR